MSWALRRAVRESLARANWEGKRAFSLAGMSRMRWVQYEKGEGSPQMLGVQLEEGGDIVEVSAACPTLPNSLITLLNSPPKLLGLAKRVVGESKSMVQLSQVNLLPPLTRPDKVVCVGLNYRSHCLEQDRPVPEEPVFFNKFPSTIVGPNDSVIHPPNTRYLDWEVELVVVMGKKCRRVTKEDAKEHIFGYTIAQDITAREWQKKNGGQWLLGKSMDTFCPLGPAVVAKEFLPDPGQLDISCSVNGVSKQSANTSDMSHHPYDIVSFLSQCITLLPGDLILTGTPAGVGVFQKPRQFLQVGDVVESEISGIGRMVNKIIKF